MANSKSNTAPKKKATKKKTTKKEPTKKKATKKKPIDEALEKRRQVRDAYIKSYKERWGIELNFAAKHNTLVKSLVDQVGFDQALELVEKYPSYPDPYHVKRKHSLDMLLHDYQAVLVWMHDPRRVIDHLSISNQANEAAKKIESENWRQRMAKELDEEKGGFLDDI